MINQDDLFKESEGDDYFQRRKNSNWSDEERIAEDLPLSLIKRNKLKIKNAAEVGAYNGFRLAHLVQNYNCKAVAFEPSQKAVKDGKERYPHIIFHRNTASKLDAADGAFDTVIVSFVFHWIDRKMLLRSVSEIDRILADEGHLVISDFLVSYPQRCRYHHLPQQEVWTYKQKYEDIFISTNCYTLVDSLINKPSGKDTVSRNCVLLKKSLSGNYPVVPYKTDNS